MRFKKIRLHPHDYTLVYSDDIDADGETSFNKRRITINESGNKQYDCGTLLHEILHALLHEINYFEDDKVEEDFVLRLEPRLLAVMQDNPELFKYLISGGKK